ncbi:MAG TPA: regulatory iron-sulfur-containing complex subunit RicT [Gemmatimonadales bacterium]|jgi:cell fate regulator YaaT (PSP1 superfamily)
MPATVEVRFKGIRKDYFLWSDESEPLRLRDPVIVEVERGFDFGLVSLVGDTAAKKCTSCSSCAVGADQPDPANAQRAVVRRASQEEIRQANELRRQEEEVRKSVTEKARTHGLAMRISDAEWQWDRKKLTVYFTAEQRVDFRNLVREMAGQYRTRIELRQIGMRDEAARLGGVGRCGREYCCSTWLKDLSPVSLSLAKDQHLSLNPAQISGGCGRLLCCLRYEHEFYVTSRKRFPKEGKTLRTGRGPEKVVAVDIFRERVFLRNDELGPRTVLLADLKAELEALGEPLIAAPVVDPAPPPAAGPVAVPALPAAAQKDATPAVTPRRRRRRRRNRRGGPPGGSPSTDQTPS